MRKSLLESFFFAFKGFWYALKRERNLRIHLVAGAAALALGGVLGLSYLEFAVVVLLISLVLAAELFNTAVERMMETAREANPRAGLIKDISAAAVLVTAIGAVAIGALIFLPHLLGD